MIDIQALAARLLEAANRFVPEWIPGGARDVDEWTGKNPLGDGVAIVNMRTGTWMFTSGESGLNLVELYACVRGLDDLMGAARELGSHFGMGDRAVKRAKVGKDGEPDWLWVSDVLPTHPVAPLAHTARGKPLAKCEYRSAKGALLGYTYKFKKSTGGFERLPLSLWQDVATGTLKWRFATFPQPRPLYGLDRLENWPERPVLLAPHEDESVFTDPFRISGAQGAFVYVSFQGGAAAALRTDWKPLANRDVLIWPERSDAGVAKAIKLRNALVPIARRVELVDVYRIGPDWRENATLLDVPTADVGKIRLALQAALDAMQAPSVEVARPGAYPYVELVADDGEWERRLFRKPNLEIKDCRENVARVLRYHPAWRGVIGWSEFAYRPEVRSMTPWFKASGEWDDSDDFALGDWLGQNCGFTVAAPTNISLAVRQIAKQMPFHPVREFIQSCRSDGVPRLDHWVVDCLGAPDTEYHRMVGRHLLINMVRRVFEPGCVMRQVVVLEGQQNRGKSSAIRVLAQPWYVDTPFKVGDKDSFQAFRGCLIYEIAEFDALSRADDSAAKAMISSRSDRFRAPYERDHKDWPRQIVLVASVNGDRYLRDRTGNTRYNPVVTGQIDLVKLAEWRPALFAEAYAAYLKGEQAYPDEETEQRLFKPEQDLRMIEDPWDTILLRWLEQEEKRTTSDYVAKVDGVWRFQFTTADVLKDCLKFEPSKMGSGNVESRRVRSALQHMGFVSVRSTTHDKDGKRPWIWTRPTSDASSPASPAPAGSAPAEDDDDDVPF